MKKIILFLALAALMVSFYRPILSWIPAKWLTHQIAYAQIKDISHPTLDDYIHLQKFLSKGRRAELSLLKDMEKRCRHIRIIGETPEEIPKQGMIAVNCGENDKENCLLVYASYNKGFPKGLQRLLDHVVKSDFKGHILYRIGGWPNVAEDDLDLAHVPYAFKVCFFREAKRLGYKRALWLDASIIPVVSLNRVFDEIGGKGYFVMGNSWMIQPLMNEQAAYSLGVTMEECSQIPSCSAGLFGIDFNGPAQHILTEWYRAARDPYAFFSVRSDQNALSAILYKLGFQEMAPITTLTETPDAISENTLFLIDREFVHQ